MDLHKNFAYSTVATAPSPATSGTSLTVASGQGALFPTPPFNATVWPTAVQPLSTNAEIVRVTAIATDTFTITRAQEGSSARSIVVGDQIAATVTAKTLTDAEADRTPFAGWIPVSGKIETLPRFVLSSGSFTLVSGTLYLLALQTPLLAGVTYSSITFISNTAATSPTNQWFTLVRKSDRKTLRSTTDDTTTAWGASTVKTLSLSSTYTPTVDTDAYVGIMVAATTPIQVRNYVVQTTITNQVPLLYGTSNTGLTTPLADDTTVNALTGMTSAWYGLVS